HGRESLPLHRVRRDRRLNKGSARRTVNALLPESIPEALDMLARDPAAVPMAGGTDLLVHWPVRIEAHDRTYVDLSRLEDLKPLTWKANELVLGALTTYWDVIRDERVGREFPLLVQAARQVGAIQIQARGTWAGNVVNASPAADGVPALMAYDATVVLESRRGAPTIRRCPAVERLLETGARAGVSSSEDLSPAIAQDVAPIDDIRSSARYRNRAMARVLYHDLKDFWRPRA